MGNGAGKRTGTSLGGQAWSGGATLAAALNRQGPPNNSPSMETASFNLGTVLLAVSGLFVLTTLYFGTKGGYYDTDDYDGNGTAH